MDSPTKNTQKRQRTQSVLLYESPAESNILSFAPIVQSNIRLFELNDSVKGELKEGDSLTLIGEGDEDAVLCSSKTTYAIKKVEMSNEIYLVSTSEPMDNSDYKIAAAASHFYELLPIAGKVQKLKELLQSSKYPQYSSRNPYTIYTRADVKNRIQASDAELSKYCGKIDVIEIDGHIRLLNRDALKATARSTLDTIIASSLDLCCISFAELLGLMANGGGDADGRADKVLLGHVLQSLSKESVDGDKWVLDAQLVQAASADLLLFEYYGGDQSKKPWPMNDFFLTWEARTPTAAAPFTPSLDLLRGIAITATAQSPATEKSSDGDVSVVNYGLIYAPVNILSLNVSERIGQLFHLRGKDKGGGGHTMGCFFLLDELTPYFEEFIGVTGQPKSVVALLLPHTTLLDGQYYLK